MEVLTFESLHPDLCPIALRVVVFEITADVPAVPLVWVGVVPSVVYIMVAPAVVVEMETVCENKYVPPPGLNAGVETFSVYIPDDIAESVRPDAVAKALSVVLAVMLTGPV